jgi:hypothetical protein
MIHGCWLVCLLLIGSACALLSLGLLHDLELCSLSALFSVLAAICGLMFLWGLRRDARLQPTDTRQDWWSERRAEVLFDIRDSVAKNRRFKSDGGIVAGYRVTVGPDCPDKYFDGKFISIVDAANHPDLLPPYLGCRHDTCECQFDIQWL